MKRKLIQLLLYKNGYPRIFTFKIKKYVNEFWFKAPLRIGLNAKKRGVENQICRLICNNTNKGELVLDVGSNYGYISLLSAASGFNVQAFEAIPFIAQVLKSSIKKNHFNKKITVHNVAVSLSNSEAINLQFLDNSFEVKSRSLDSCEIQSKVRIIKIDIDGEEYQVLKGGKNLILNNMPIIVVELNKEKVEIINLLKEFGYKKFSWTNGAKFKDEFPPNLVASCEDLKFN